MYNSYKDQFNEWAYQVWQETGKDPELEDIKDFKESWLDSLCDRADYERKKRMGE